MAGCGCKKRNQETVQQPVPLTIKINEVQNPPTKPDSAQDQLNAIVDKLQQTQPTQ